MFMMAVVSAVTASTKKRSSVQAMRPPSSAKVTKASNVQLPQVKDKFGDDTIGVEDDVLECILVEATSAVEVKPEVEDQAGSGQLNNSSFCSTNRSLFLLGHWEDRQLSRVVTGKITVSSKQQPSLNFIFTLNRLTYFVALLKDIDTKVKELNRKTCSVSFRRHLGDPTTSVLRPITTTSHIYFRKYFVPHRLEVNQIRPSKCGITIHINEWVIWVGVFFETQCRSIVSKVAA